MAIETVAAIAAKEVAVEATKEAALQSAREIAQKMATEAGAQGSGPELQTAMMERQTMQEGFRIGEMPETKGEGREILKQRENDAAEELRGKLDSEETRPEEIDSVPEIDPSEVQNAVETEVRPAEVVQETVESQKAIDSAELTETHECVEAVEHGEPVKYNLITRNQSLEGDVHPVTGVEFEKKTVVDAEGNEATGVFPKFESVFDAQLPRDMLKSSDKEQFTECNNQLKDAVSKDPEVSKKFSGDQLEQIKNGDTPDGYTWHHNEECGKMQLVKSDVHAQTGHTGGRSIWGGGSEFRV